MKAVKTLAAPLSDGQETVARLYGQMDERRQRQVMRFVTDTMVAQWRADPEHGKKRGAK